MKTNLVLLAISSAIALPAAVGCGGDGETTTSQSAEVRIVGERFATAVGVGDLRTACRELFSEEYRRSLDVPALGTQCEDLAGSSAFGSPSLKGLFVGAVEVQGQKEATVRFKNSPVYLQLQMMGSDGWRITGVGP